MTDLSGQSLGRYHLLERLGEGGMAVVYKAYDTLLERQVAVKIIRREAFPPETLPEVLARFEREAKALARLAHANIVRVYDFGEHEGSPFLVMEYIPGGTLKQKLGQPIPWQRAIHLLLPVARGVAYAHRHGILHRDIKPANILVTAEGEPLLTDFGIAKVFEGEQSVALTATGMFVGTPEYTAPEQWTGHTSPQSDIYALGIVLYELIVGRKPYEADTPAAILLKQTSEPLPRPGAFVGGLPEALEMILVKALARDPADRYKDMNAMADAMQALFPPLPLNLAVPQTEAGASGAPLPETKVYTTSGPKVSRLVWVAIGVVFVSLVGTFYLLAGRPSRPLPSAPQAAITEAGTVEADRTPVTQTESLAAAIVPSETPDVCAGATDPGAREMFTLEQITPCLDSVSKVSAFMANNIRMDGAWDAENCGELCYSPAWLVYQNGVDDLHGLVTLECYFLEKNGFDAYHLGLSIESPVGTNLCGVVTEDGVLVLEPDGKTVGSFASLAEVARFYINHGMMVNGGQLRTIRASEITQLTTNRSTPSLSELPWVFHPY